EAQQGPPGAGAHHGEQQGWPGAGRAAHRWPSAEHRFPAAANDEYGVPAAARCEHGAAAGTDDAPGAVVSHGRCAMTPEEPSGPAAAPIGWLLRLGGRAATSSALTVLILAGVLAASRVVWRTLVVALLTADPAIRLERTLIVSAAGLLLATFLARAGVLAVGVQSGAARVPTAPDLPALSPARAGLRGISWAAAAAGGGPRRPPRCSGAGV